MARFPDVRSLMPHAGPSCLLESVVRADAHGTECRALITRDHPYLKGDGVHPLLVIELLAQAAAVHRALNAPDAGPSESVGVLAAANARVHVSQLQAPSTCRVRIAPVGALGNAVSFTGELYLDDDGAVAATGDVTVVLGGSSPLGAEATA